jgi:hypothetical protein
MNVYFVLALVVEWVKVIAKFACRMKGKNVGSCEGQINVIGPVLKEFRYMVNDTVLCTRMKICIDYKYEVDSDIEFAKRVLKDKPIRNRPKPLNSTAPLKILVFSDPHIDFDYEEVGWMINYREEAHNVIILCVAEETPLQQKEKNGKQENMDMVDVIFLI